MKTFTVEGEYLRGSIFTGAEVFSDGEVASYNSEDKIDAGEITVGYSVHTYDEDGAHLDTKFYPVHTDMTDWSDDSEQVLAKIKADYPPTEYQNNNW